MSTHILKCLKVFGAGFMLATLMASFAAFSQDVSEPEDKSFEAVDPAVDMSSDTAAACAEKAPKQRPIKTKWSQPSVSWTTSIAKLMSR